MRLLLLLAGLLVSVLGAAVVKADVDGTLTELGAPIKRDTPASIDARSVAEITDVSVDSATSIQQGCKESRKTCDASVMYFRDIKYRGECANFMSSIQLRPRKDGRKWGRMLYADSSCKGNDHKSEAIWITESRDRFLDWNDRTKSIRCG